MKYSIEDVQKNCKEKYGECLSTVYKSRMKFRCKFGHEWEASVGNIIGRNSWCPICSSSLYERICRLYFETIFQESFPKKYPKWLKNSQGNQLELDGYCKKYGVAFEHQGMQHYRLIFFRNEKYNFNKLLQNDKEKKELCKQNNVKLFIIPELFSITKINDLKKIIRQQFIDLNINIPLNYESIIIDYNYVYNTDLDKEKLDQLRNKLLLNNYRLLSDKYYGVNCKYKVECLKCGNIRYSIYATLFSHNCSSCEGIKRRNSLQDAQELAKEKNGKCLSQEYINNFTKMNWVCVNGHQWKTSYNMIQRGRWCPICAKVIGSEKRKLSINKYMEAAIKKGGECLSDNINSCYDKLEWKCNNGHIWKATACAIKNTKQWCPECAKINQNSKL